MTLYYCKACLDKQQQINHLLRENEQLKAQLRWQKRSAAQGPFGASTPSSKVPVKPNALAERQARRGGATRGHAGHGRRGLTEHEADRVEEVAVEAASCPACQVALRGDGRRARTVWKWIPGHVEQVRYHLEERVCPQCRRRYAAQAPGVLPRSLYDNGVLSHVAEQHYLWGVPMGRLAEQLGVGGGTLLGGQARLARLLEPAVEVLVKEYQRAPVKHADETSWRTDGQNGYGWLFATPRLSVFRLRQSRSAQVAAEVLSPQPLPGVLVVDRYHAYNRAPVALQYCYAHLKRDVEEVGKAHPDDPEVRAFVGRLSPALGQAMHLRTLGLEPRAFLQQAATIQRRIIAIVHRPARHEGIRKIQAIFRKHKDRMYHWARDPSIPAENNQAERDLRPLVIARKISFGSQSESGARTRETLMTLLHTLRKRGANVRATLQAALDRLAQDPALDVATLLFGP